MLDTEPSNEQESTFSQKMLPLFPKSPGTFLPVPHGPEIRALLLAGRTPLSPGHLRPVPADSARPLPGFAAPARRKQQPLARPPHGPAFRQRGGLLRRCPAAAASNGSLLLTGGMSQLYGLDTLISKALSIDVTIPSKPDLCVSKGCEVALKKMHILDQYGYSFKTKEEVRTR